MIPRLETDVPKIHQSNPHHIKYVTKPIKSLFKTNPNYTLHSTPLLNKLANLSANHCFVLSLALTYTLWHFVIAGES